jgi:hypothetical protein
MTRRSTLLAVTWLGLAPLGAVAQPFALLREDPEDYWADVHRWTGSEATRPRARRTVPAGDGAADREARQTVRTTATTRANIRAGPSLDAPILRRLPPASRLVVFGQAPGGWFHVGDTAPFGWIHESALQR